MTVDRSHPLRFALHDEVHARPPLSLPSPSRLTCLALMASADDVAQELALLGELATLHGLPPPGGEAGHCVIEAPAFRLKWERHTEYSRYVIAVDGAGSRPFAEPASDALPRDWLARLPGQTLYAGHAEVLPAQIESGEGFSAISRESFADRALVGSLIAGGLATVLTDFRIDEQGYSRLLLIDRGMTAAQSGRAVQALLEVDTYRMLALLAFPVARQLSPQLARDERELSSIA
ncbi:MAG: DUF3422 family protein, partial [Steroidobacteraceae bacterium]